MYLSQILVNTAGSPDQPRPGVEWLRNTYRVHQRLWMAFPDAEAVEADPFFLGTWSPPPAAPAGKPRRAEAGFLFRIEPDRPTRILVQSVQKPDWDYAFQNAPHLLAPGQPPEVRTFEPAFTAGQRYRFRLVAQMIKRHTDAAKPRRGGAGKGVTERALPPDAHDGPAGNAVPFSAWRKRLAGFAEKHGFSVNAEDPARAADPDFVRVRHAPRLSAKRAPPTAGGNKTVEELNAALFDGVLTCLDPEALRAAVVNGVGRGKAFGCGLLSVIPIG